MNYKELQKHIDTTIVDNVPTLAKDGSNASDFFLADVVSAKSFMQNYGGYPRSDIAIISDESNAAMQQAMLSDLVELPINENAGLTDVEISLAHRSKYQQTPSEMQDWLEAQLEYRDMLAKANQPEEKPDDDIDNKKEVKDE